LRTALSEHLQGAFAAQWAAGLGMRRAFVLHDTEPGGRGVALPFADACRRLGVELAEPPVGIEPKRREYEALAEAVAGSGAELVFYGGIIQNGAGPLWRDIRSVAPAITMMGPNTLFEHAFIDDAGAHAEGTLITFGGVPPALLAGRGREFLEHYLERFGLKPECYAASAYDATGVILQAIERVGRIDRAAITEAAFATRDFDGLLGRWSFDANGDIDLRRATRLTVRAGRFEPLNVLPISERSTTSEPDLS
jgi:branched-chain amino acid transport system substrate-binding protein